MSISLVGVVEVAAVGAFAYTGAEVGRRRQMDVVGVTSLAIVNGLAGGMVRDVLIDRSPVALHDARLLPTCLVAALVVMVFGAVAKAWIIEALDAVGLGLFSVIGTSVALDAGVTSLAAVLLGAVTVAAGGVARDVLAGERPAVLYRSELYVIVSTVGGAVYVLARRAGVGGSGLLLGVAGAIAVARLLARRLGWNSPVPLEPMVRPRRVRVFGRHVRVLGRRRRPGEPPA